WPGSRVREDADGFSFHVAPDGEKVVQILKPSLPFGNAAHNAMNPAGSLTARGALSAGLVGEEPYRGIERFHHAGGLIHDDHTPGTGHAARRHERVEIHRNVDLIGCQNFGRDASGDDGLELVAVAHTTSQLDKMPQGHTHRLFINARPGHMPAHAEKPCSTLTVR